MTILGRRLTDIFKSRPVSVTPDPVLDKPAERLPRPPQPLSGLIHFLVRAHAHDAEGFIVSTTALSVEGFRFSTRVRISTGQRLSVKIVSGAASIDVDALVTTVEPDGRGSFNCAADFSGILVEHERVIENLLRRFRRHIA